jgi:hypothetical protein
MDVDKLMKALDNDENSKFLNLTTKKITEIKTQILKELEFSREEIKDLLIKLKEYMYVDEVNEIRYGSFIRWISIKDPDPSKLYLTQGAILCDVKMMDNGIILCCKNYAHKHFQIALDENIIFQKLSGQEQVLLSALDHLEKT